MNIGDLYFALRGDGAKLQQDAVAAATKAGDAAGKTLGQRLTSGLKTGAFAAITAGAAIAGKGLIELSSIQADFQAATGATADEAERAGKAINRMAGSNLQPLREVGDTLTIVHTDLGLTGDAAEVATEKFLKYGTATKQGPAAAVKDFDDILDAWNLTADHSGEIMDALVAGHQKYGGSITANQKALAAMAPQLIALNASWQDGVGLLNLFAASGIDAATVTRALNTAVSKLKPGQTLDDLVAQISSIEDPTLRAKKAIELFGARGGVALANALRPGINGLGDFEIGANDAAGATEKAAGAIESAFPNWLALRIKGIGSAIIGLGQTIGPLGSALTGIISLGGALGFDKLFGRLGPKARDGLAGLWRSVATSSAVTGAIAFASDKAATLYLKALIAGDVMAAALAGVWSRLIALPVVGGAISAAGTAAGLAFASAAAFAIATAPIVALKVAIEWVADQANIVRLGGKGNTVEELLARKAAREAQAAADAAAHDRDAQKAWEDAGIAYGERLASGFYSAGPQIETTVSQVVSSSIAGGAQTSSAVARAIGRRAAGALADGIRDTRDAFDQAWNEFLDALKNVETPSKRLARLLGRLASKELAKGLTDSRPEVKARANEVLQATLDELGTLVKRGRPIGKAGMEALRLGMKSKVPDIRNAATQIYNTIKNHLPSAATAKRWGTALGNALAAGLLASNVASVVIGLAKLMQSYWQTHSPAKLGPLSEGGGPEGWGKSIVALLTTGVASGLARFSDTLNRGMAIGPQLALAQAVPSVGFAPSALAAPASIGGDTYNIDVKVEGKPPAHDPVGVARQLARFSQAGAFKVRR